MKKTLSVLILFLLVAGASFAQQITKIAVLDTDRIYSTFRMESQAARDYEKKQQQYQQEIDGLKEEIMKYKSKKLEAVKANKSESTIKKYDEVIASKTSFLKEYASQKSDELKALKKKLITSDEFYSMLYKALQQVAETEGYTAVFSLQESVGILWYSQTIDITDDVISALSTMK